jgi:hypothetical protein
MDESETKLELSHYKINTKFHFPSHLATRGTVWARFALLLMQSWVFSTISAHTVLQSPLPQGAFKLCLWGTKHVMELEKWSTQSSQSCFLSQLNTLKRMPSTSSSVHSSWQALFPLPVHFIIHWLSRRLHLSGTRTACLVQLKRTDVHLLFQPQ